MVPTRRESDAARRLGEALLEFFMAIEAGARTRAPVPAPQPPPPPPPLPPPAPLVQRALSAPEPKEERPALLTVLEAAAYLAVSPGTLFNHSVPRGPIPRLKFGTSVRYARKDLDAAIDRMRAVQ